MAFLGLTGIKLKDVIAGAAKAVDDTLKEDIKRTKTFADDVWLYHQTKRREASTEYTENKKEVGDILTGLSSFVDKEKMTEGTSPWDYAAQLYAGAGGTTITAQQLLDDLIQNKKLGISTKDLINY